MFRRLFLVAALSPAIADAAPPLVVALRVAGHHFTPDHIAVPSGQRLRVTLTNADDTVDEFESYDMKFEKIVVPGSTITVFAGPLHPGSYSFFDDYHPDQAKGVLTAAGAEP